MNRPTKELLNKVADVQEVERQCEKQIMGVHGLLYPSHHTFGLKEMIMVGIIQMNPLHLK